MVSLKVGLEMNAKHEEAKKEAREAAAAPAPQEQKGQGAPAPKSRTSTWFSSLMPRRVKSESDADRASQAGSDSVELFM